MKWFFIIVTVSVIAFNSCNSKQDYKPVEQSGFQINCYAIPSTSSNPHDDDRQKDSFKLNPMTDKYEDGYEDGQAAAEEDRLAGRPGMQSGGMTMMMTMTTKMVMMTDMRTIDKTLRILIAGSTQSVSCFLAAYRLTHEYA